jgi:hypothetical protein
VIVLMVALYVILVYFLFLCFLSCMTIFASTELYFLVGMKFSFVVHLSDV